MIDVSKETSEKYDLLRMLGQRFESCQLLASDKSNLTEKSSLSSETWFPSYSILYCFRGWRPFNNCCKLCLQKSTTIVFKKLQNNVGFAEYLSDWGLNLIIVTWLYYFSKNDT